MPVSVAAESGPPFSSALIQPALGRTLTDPFDAAFVCLASSRSFLAFSKSAVAAAVTCHRRRAVSAVASTEMGGRAVR